MSNSREISQLSSFITVDDATKNIGITSGITPFVGIGSTSPTVKLDVVGDANVSGNVTAQNYYGSGANLTGISTFANANIASGIFSNIYVSGISTLGITSATNLTSQQLYISGIATLTQISAGGTVGAAGSILSSTGSGLSWIPAASGGSGGSALSIFTSTSSTPQFITFVSSASTTSIGITASNLTFIPSSGSLGIGTTNPTSKLHVVGDVRVTGVMTATTFVGALTGIAASATQLVTPRTFEITGDVVASPVSFDGAGNVSFAATIQPNSVGLGTDTTGDYVRDITGTVNQISVSATSGEGSTPTLSIPSQFTAPQDVTVTRDLLVSRNLNVNGNITIGGTSATLFTTELKISDPDIVLGFRTDGSGNDVSNDNTANHGGVALASTEGTPLVDLFIAGIETNPSTYKKIMWFKSGTFAGLGTDAWLINYAVGIGSTQFPTGTRLAAGNVQFTQNDLAVVRNINASGVVTATTFIGALTGTATNAGIATNLKGGVIGNIPYQSAADTTVFLTNGGSGTVLQSNGVGAAPSWVAAAPSGAVSGITVRDSNSNIVGTSGSITQLTFSTGLSVTGTTGAAGIATITLSSNIVGTSLSISGISTFTNGPVLIGSGTSTGTTSQPLQVTGGAYVSGNLGIGTTNPGATLNVVPTATSIAGLFSGTTSGDMVRITQLGTGNALVVEDSTNPDSTPFVVKGDGSVGIGTTNPTSKLHVIGDVLVSGVVTATTFVGALTGTASSTTNIPNLTGAITSVNTTTSLGSFTSAQLATALTDETGSGSAVFATSPTLTTPVLGAATATSIVVSSGSTFTNGPILVGTGTSTGTASQPLQVTGGAYVSGSVGIGTTNPTSKLHVIGDVLVSGVVTATTFVGALTGTASSTTNIPNLTGDITSVNKATTLATVNSNVGTFGGTDAIPVVTVNGKGLVTGVSTVAPNNGTLTLAVSGTGLSGSASFTANQSGSSSFTVTSNATNANTVSTIVARDASGNFSAGTITANLTGTATSTTNIPNLTGAITSVNTTTSLGSFSSANLATALTDETGSGSAVFATSPTLVTPVLGSASATSIVVSSGSTFTNGPILVGTGTSTGTALQPLQVTGGAYVSGKIGIGTTNPQGSLHIFRQDTVSGIETHTDFILENPGKGNARFFLKTRDNNRNWEFFADDDDGSFGIYDGVAPARRFTILPSGNVLIGSSSTIGTGTTDQRLQVTGGAYVSGSVGIGTTNPTSKLHVVDDVRVTGVVTATTFIGALTGTATTAGIATNLKGGVIGNIPYQSAADTTVFLTNGGSGTVLQSNGVGNAPTWVAAAPTGAVTGLVVRDFNNNIVGTSGSVSQLTFSTGLSVTGTTGAAGIATITLSSNIVGTSLSISGISTFANGPILIGSGTSTGTTSQPLQVTGGAYVSGNLGVGVTAPAFKADIAGDVRVTSENKMRFGGTAGTTNFYIQHNSTTNSLDFVAG